MSGILEAGLWLLFLVCAGIAGISGVRAEMSQRTALAGFPLQSDGVVSAASTPTKAGEVIGRLEIPQLELEVPVLESFDSETLRRGVGHVPGTALPGGLGNLVLAGHRDTFFRSLRNIRVGMIVAVSSRDGRFEYVVDSSEIVTPARVDVLDGAERPGMTLITCYPFDFIGAAPKRFIVHAHLISDPA